MSVLVLRAARYLLTRPIIACKRGGHAWTTMAEPPFCVRCHRTAWYA